MSFREFLYFPADDADDGSKIGWGLKAAVECVTVEKMTLKKKKPNCAEVHVKNRLG